jgi:hypothetical protein
MLENKIQCPYCNGTRFIHTGYVEKVLNGRRSLYPYAQPCYCDLNVSISKKFGMLSPLPDATPQDSQAIYKKYSPKDKSKGNYIFYGDEQAFLYTVKCYFMQGYTNQNYELLEGVNIVDRYNRPDADGNRPTIAALDQFDLVVILFTSRTEPPSLKACVADVVKNRARVSRPIWIFSRTKDLSTTKESGPDLATYLEQYECVELGVSTSYSGFSKEESEKTQIKKSRDTQDDLGRI